MSGELTLTVYVVFLGKCLFGEQSCLVDATDERCV